MATCCGLAVQWLTGAPLSCQKYTSVPVLWQLVDGDCCLVVEYIQVFSTVKAESWHFMKATLNLAIYLEPKRVENYCF